MSDHIKAGDTFAKSAGEPKRDFNAEQEFAEYIPKLSEKGRERFKLVTELGVQRLEKEASSQKRSHTYRVLREENSLLKKYISSPDPRPKNLDVSQDLKIISEQAERNVMHKEAQYMQNVKYDVRSNLQQIINQDFREQQHAQTSQSPHAPQMEH